MNSNALMDLFFFSVGKEHQNHELNHTFISLEAEELRFFVLQLTGISPEF